MAKKKDEKDVLVVRDEKTGEISVVELSKDRIVIFSTHIIEDISSSCSQVATSLSLLKNVTQILRPPDA